MCWIKNSAFVGEENLENFDDLISGFRRDAVEIYALLSPYASSPLKIGLIDCTETSAKIYHYKLRNKPDERRSQTTPTFCMTVLFRTAG